MARHPTNIVRVKPVSKKFQDASGTGRVELYSITLCGATECLVFVFYGWTGGHQDSMAAGRTDSIIEAILEEVSCQPPLPCLMMGDLNANTEDIPHVVHMIDSLGWHDLGAEANTWGGTPNEHTCVTSGTLAPTRSDYIFCNAKGFPLVRAFHVIHSDLFSVHSILQVALVAEGADSVIYKSKVPSGFQPFTQSSMTVLITYMRSSLPHLMPIGLKRHGCCGLQEWRKLLLRSLGWARLTAGRCGVTGSPSLCNTSLTLLSLTATGVVSSVPTACQNGLR